MYTAQGRVPRPCTRQSPNNRALVRLVPTSSDRCFFGRQATLRGCDGYAHYPLAQWRNGQWADPMLAHAGTEAVRLVPFSSLLLSAESVSKRIPIFSMALAAVPGACDGLQRCTDLSSVQRRARRCAGRECSRGARSTRVACAEHEKNLLFSAARSARAEAVRRSRARRREVRALLCTLAVWKGRGCMVSSV